MIRIILLTLFLLFVPNNLASLSSDFFIEKWPCVIMEAHNYQYIMDEPGGEIRKVENDQTAHQSLSPQDTIIS